MRLIILLILTLLLSGCATSRFTDLPTCEEFDFISPCKTEAGLVVLADANGDAAETEGVE